MPTASIPVSKLKEQIIYAVLNEDSLNTAFELLVENFQNNPEIVKKVIIQKKRYDRLHEKELLGIISSETAEQRYNQIYWAVLQLTRNIPEDNQPDVVPIYPSSAREGKVYYSIPEKMKIEESAVCRIRLAVNERIILKGLEEGIQGDIKDIHAISDLMKVELFKHPQNAPFEIHTYNNQNQNIFEIAPTEWQYFVTPRQKGEYDLIFKVSTIVAGEGKELVRERILREKVIVTHEDVEPFDLEKEEKKAAFSLIVGSGTVFHPGLENPVKSANGTTVFNPFFQWAILLCVFGLFTLDFLNGPEILGAFRGIQLEDKAQAIAKGETKRPERGKPSDLELWSFALYKHTIDGYETYLKESPEGNFRGKAEEFIKRLNGLAVGQVPENNSIHPAFTPDQVFSKTVLEVTLAEIGKKERLISGLDLPDIKTGIYAQSVFISPDEEEVIFHINDTILLHKDLFGSQNSEYLISDNSTISDIRFSPNREIILVKHKKGGEEFIEFYKAGIRESVNAVNIISKSLHIDFETCPENIILWNKIRRQTTGGFYKIFDYSGREVQQPTFPYGTSAHFHFVNCETFLFEAKLNSDNGKNGNTFFALLNSFGEISDSKPGISSGNYMKFYNQDSSGFFLLSPLYKFPKPKLFRKDSSKIKRRDRAKFAHQLIGVNRSDNQLREIYLPNRYLEKIIPVKSGYLFETKRKSVLPSPLKGIRIGSNSELFLLADQNNEFELNPLYSKGDFRPFSSIITDSFCLGVFSRKKRNDYVFFNFKTLQRNVLEANAQREIQLLPHNKGFLLNPRSEDKEDNAKLFDFSGDLIHQFEEPGKVWSVFPKDSSLLISRQKKSTFREATLRNLSGNEISKIESPDGILLKGIIFSGRGDKIIGMTRGKAGLTFMWDLNGNLISKFKHPSGLRNILFSSNDKYFITNAFADENVLKKNKTSFLFKTEEENGIALGSLDQVDLALSDSLIIGREEEQFFIKSPDNQTLYEDNGVTGYHFIGDSLGIVITYRNQLSKIFSLSNLKSVDTLEVNAYPYEISSDGLVGIRDSTNVAPSRVFDFKNNQKIILKNWRNCAPFKVTPKNYLYAQCGSDFSMWNLRGSDLVDLHFVSKVYIPANQIGIVVYYENGNRELWSFDAKKIKNLGKIELNSEEFIFPEYNSEIFFTIRKDNVSVFDKNDGERPLINFSELKQYKFLKDLRILALVNKQGDYRVINLEDYFN